MTYVLLDTKQYFPSDLETKYGTILLYGTAVYNVSMDEESAHR